MSTLDTYYALRRLNDAIEYGIIEPDQANMQTIMQEFIRLQQAVLSLEELMNYNHTLFRARQMPHVVVQPIKIHEGLDRLWAINVLDGDRVVDYRYCDFNDYFEPVQLIIRLRTGEYLGLVDSKWAPVEKEHAYRFPTVLRYKAQAEKVVQACYGDVEKEFINA